MAASAGAALALGPHERRDEYGDSDHDHAVGEVERRPVRNLDEVDDGPRRMRSTRFESDPPTSSPSAAGRMGGAHLSRAKKTSIQITTADVRG